MDRRHFLQQSAAAGAGLMAVPALAQPKSPNEKLNVACIGIEGRGGSDLAAVAATENIVALCDVDDEKLARVGQKFPNAYRETDYRRLAERKDIDAFIVATPDHHHAFATSMALQLGKHCYCEKPLTHSVYEARRIAEMAKKAGVATQMGNQGHSNNGTRRVVELIRPEWSGRSGKRIAGRTVRSGPKALTARRSARLPRIYIGTCGSDPRRTGRLARATIRSSGAVFGTSAPARSATWRVT